MPASWSKRFQHTVTAAGQHNRTNTITYTRSNSIVVETTHPLEDDEDITACLHVLQLTACSLSTAPDTVTAHKATHSSDLHLPLLDPTTPS
jgi:hypothetical protein